MKLSQKRKTDEILRARYIAIIENSKEKPWDDRSDKILEAFFSTNKTYQEIANEIGISRARVGQILNLQVRRILHPTGLKKYWEPDYNPDIILTPEHIKKTQIKLEQQYGSIDNWPVKEILFSPRTRNSLLRANITTVGELIERMPCLNEIKGLGGKALSEINSIIEAYEWKKPGY
ncbi:MAG: hypothetical protein GXY40_09130 [Syntrophomonadaceae bacterium]|nr:hypothetical protein [Syntrophomonadaceae bacterium]